MRVTGYKTDKIIAGGHDLLAVLDAAIPALAEGSVVAVTSKIVALCEGRAVPVGEADKDELIRRESSQFLPRSFSRYNASFAITHGLLMPMAGIDESNGNGNYVLLPKDPQASANALRRHLCAHFGVQNVGVIITDSCLRPLRWGATGMSIAASGFVQIIDMIGQRDLFGRPLQFTKEGVQDGLAAAAALVMGEGSQQTPIAVLEDVPFVTFTRRNPTPEELAAQRIAPEDDLYGPFLTAVPWQPGEQKN